MQKYCWHTQPVSGGNTYVFTLRWKDTGDTDSANCNHILAVPKVLQTFVSLGVERRVTDADFIPFQRNVAYGSPIASLICMLGSKYLYDCDGILVQELKVDGAAQNFLPAEARALILSVAQSCLSRSPEGTKIIRHTTSGT